MDPSWRETIVFRRVITAIAVIGAIGTGGMVWAQIGHSNAQRLAFASQGKKITFATDPAVFGGGDKEMDNLYTLANYICTNGIATTIVHQDLGDVNNSAAHQGHYLELKSIQDYGTVAPSLPLGFDASGDPTPGTSVPLREANGVDNGYTFASASDNSSGTWTGNTYYAHYGTAANPVTFPVGEQIVGSFVRADHGFVVNEDDDNRNTGAPVDLSSPGDDGRNNRYQGWTGSEDGSNNGGAPTTPNVDNDWYVAPDGTGPTDGSSFDDVIRTDQSPTGPFDMNDPNSAPSDVVPPNPTTSTVQDCVLDQAPPQTAITLPGGSVNGWYNNPISLALA